MKRKINALLRDIGENISTKFININNKTSMGDVPKHLFQERTSRQKRVLISWKEVYKNKLTIDQLETFESGVCVEFVNDDFFNKDYLTNTTHKELINKLGSDDNVASIISFRTEDGDPGANAARDSFEKFKKLNPNFELKPILRVGQDKDWPSGTLAIGNEKWEGNSYYEIKGGLQKELSSHSNLTEDREKKPMLFNPAIEYANEEVCDDIFISLFYYFIHCHDIQKYINKVDLLSIKKECEDYLKSRSYDDGNLLDYCNQHPSLAYEKGILRDPIEVTELNVEDFNIKWKYDNPLSIAICHEQPVNKKIYKFDKKNNYIVSPARPTNLFWGKQSSNMLQQSYTLQEFFKVEEERVEKRRSYLK